MSIGRFTLSLLIFSFLFSPLVSAAPPEDEAAEKSEWCSKCKDEMNGECRVECRAQQGGKFFVCVEDCSLKRCEMACTAADEEAEKAEKAEEDDVREAIRGCGACQREARSGACAKECSEKRPSERARCKRSCAKKTCKKSCEGASRD